MNTYKLFGVAGGGKTTFCMEAVKVLIDRKEDVQEDVKDFFSNVIKKYTISDICFCSFTRASIKSIKDKFKKNNIIVPQQSYIKTLNSLTWFLMGYSESQKITNKERQDFFKKTNIEDEDIIDEVVNIYNKLVNNYCRSLTEITDNEISVLHKERGEYENNLLDTTTIIFLVRQYNKWKVDNDKKDFVDSLLDCLINKRDIPTRVLIVDEAQDLNNLQIELVKLWTVHYDRDIFIIAGDDDQTVHEWQGAKPDYLVNLSFPNMRKKILERSYRCPLNICNMCNDVFNRINFREPKKIYSTNGTGEGNITLYDEGIYKLANNLELLRNTNKEIFLLFRTNKAKEEIANILFENAGTPFGTIGRSSLHDYWSLKLICVSNAINKLIKKQDLLGVEVDYLFSVIPSDSGCLVYGAKAKVKKEIDRVFTTNEVLALTKRWQSQLTLDNFTEGGIKSKDDIIKYIEYYKPKKKDDLIQTIKKNEVYRNRLSKIDKIYSLYQTEDNKWDFDLNIKLGTYHSAKGLEADYVYVFLGTSEFFKDINDSEYRCFYVAISRTKEKLVLIPPREEDKSYLFNDVSDIILNNCVVN